MISPSPGWLKNDLSVPFSKNFDSGETFARFCQLNAAHPRWINVFPRQTPKLPAHQLIDDF
jgi:hypothetical protein